MVSADVVERQSPTNDVQGTTQYSEQSPSCLWNTFEHFDVGVVFEIESSARIHEKHHRQSMVKARLKAVYRPEDYIYVLQPSYRMRQCGSRPKVASSL